MKVYWTNNALNHLDLIYHYIEPTSAIYARRMVDKITSKSIQIANHPLSGKVIREYQLENIREVFAKPYRIIYRITINQIDVLAVVHSAMNVLANE